MLPFAALLSWLFLFPTASAQSTNASCIMPAYAWALNQHQQSPCLVAAFLETQCAATPITIPALPDQNHYLGPSFVSANPCLCSSVTYSMISACGACQGQVWEDWGNWSINCVTIDLTAYPKNVPNTTDIPLWAFLNVTTSGNTFSVQLAQANATGATSTSTSSTGVPSLPSGPSNLPTQATSNHNSKSHAGAIAGGVVGGVAFLVITGVVIFWLYSRRHRSIGTPSVVYGPADLDGGGVPSLQTNYPHSEPLSPAVQTTYNYNPHHDIMERSTSPLSLGLSAVYAHEL